jgi:hypothetical protein
MNHRRRSVSLLLLLLTAFVAGCFGGAEEAPPEELVVRTPRPTFTPTPAAPTPTPTVLAAAATNTPAGQPATGGPEGSGAIGVINSEQVNARRSPDLNPEGIIRELARGEEFTVVGRSDSDEFWQLCCIDGETFWVFESYVDTDGVVDALPVGDATATLPPPPPTNTPVAQQPAQPTATAVPPAEPVAAPPAEAPTAPADTPAPTEPPAPAFPFNLVAQEQFPESNNLVRIFLYVSQGDQVLPGYSLRVVKDGAEQAVSAVSSESAGFTWPVPDPRQRFQNMKVEFPNVQAAGAWEIQLIDGSKTPVGPPATFNLSATDTNRELYVRYEKP